MNIDEITEHIESLGGVLTLRPGPGDGSPELAWGDLFFYYAPDGVVPRTQPFATVVTKDYPEDTSSRLDREGVFRVNVFAGTEEFTDRMGYGPKQNPPGDLDLSAPDVLLPHPVYGSMGWLCVVNPGPDTETPLRDLLRSAHAAARTRYERHRLRQGTEQASLSAAAKAPCG